MAVLRKILAPLTTAVIAALIVGGLYLHFHKKPHKSTDVNANTSIIDQLNKSNTVDSKRSLASAYLAAGNYQAAEQTMKDIAAQTKDRNDYLGLLNICSVRNVPDKQACIDDAVANIKPQIDSAASELDNAGFKKDAVVFYQRAYDIYDPARVDQYTKTRDQIKQKIDELSK
jgi:hypothetical protein